MMKNLHKLIHFSLEILLIYGGFSSSHTFGKSSGKRYEQIDINQATNPCFIKYLTSNKKTIDQVSVQDERKSVF